MRGMSMYHAESLRIFNQLKADLGSLVGGTIFSIGNISINVEGKDGLGGLIEEWFGIWAITKNFIIYDPKKNGRSQEFPDYYVGNDNGLLEIKAFDYNAGANFDIANFESYCESVAHMPERANSDYLIFGYTLEGSRLRINDVWLKKIWEITCPSERWSLKTQTKRDVIYNIRPASWYSRNSRFSTFNSLEQFIDALYDTQWQYRRISYKNIYLENKIKMNAAML